jgi:hypothetical protein
VKPLALLYPGDRAARARGDPRESRFAALFDALAAAGIAAQPAVYDDDFADAVEAQLLGCAGVLVWRNPIEGGRDRRVLDALLRRVAARGVKVSSPPDTILRLGTKDVLLAVAGLPFATEARRVGSPAELRARLLALDAPVVFKQHRGHSGIGVWRVAPRGDGQFLLRHAERGATEQSLDLHGALACLSRYLANSHLIEQPWLPRMTEGMVRAYLVRDRVAGFGHQAVVALHPAGLAPTTRRYSGADDARFQGLREALEGSWVAQLLDAVGLGPLQLPLLWDLDFLVGDDGDWKLCEINASSVAPFPPEAVPLLVEAVGRW